jgi:hypothetical protein
MTAAYRSGPSIVRHALLRQRDRLLRVSTAEVDRATAEELAELAAALQSADRDPIDHVEVQLRDYEMALEAGRAAWLQRDERVWRSRVGLVIGALLMTMLGSGRIAHQLREQEREANHCLFSADCNGRCHLEVSYDGWLGSRYACVAISAADCATSCDALGACEVVSGVCMATTDAHCRASRRCLDRGRCTLDEGRCVAIRRDDCAASEGCKSFGACSPDPLTGGCYAASHVDCLGSEDCQLRGECHADDGVCMPLPEPPDADECHRLVSCVRSGFCPDDQWTLGLCAGEEPAG